MARRYDANANLSTASSSRGGRGRTHRSHRSYLPEGKRLIYGVHVAGAAYRKAEPGGLWRASSRLVALAEGGRGAAAGSDEGRRKAGGHAMIIRAISSVIRTVLSEETFDLLTTTTSGPKQYEIGLSYAEGESVPQDYTEAVRWYREAAQWGNKVQFNIDRCGRVSPYWRQPTVGPCQEESHDFVPQGQSVP